MNSVLGYFKDGGTAHSTSTQQAKTIIEEISTIIEGK
jgi:hypothetical protein